MFKEIKHCIAFKDFDEVVDPIQSKDLRESINNILNGSVEDTIILDFFASDIIMKFKNKELRIHDRMVYDDNPTAHCAVFTYVEDFTCRRYTKIIDPSSFNGIANASRCSPYFKNTSRR
ncbi:MAG: hypothetical protein IBX57_00630 [Gammaproteobacteria bacterium]|nr:hypothetical protein [Gammaproteobacteria bacterium]